MVYPRDLIISETSALSLCPQQVTLSDPSPLAAALWTVGQSRSGLGWAANLECL